MNHHSVYPDDVKIAKPSAESAGTLARWACVSTLNVFLFLSALR